MKLLNTLLIASLSLFASHAALANTPAKAKPAQEQVDKALAKFSKALALRFDGMLVKNVDNQKVISFNYMVTNKSDKTIKEVFWETTYFYKNKAVLTQSLPVAIKGGLKPNTAVPLEFSIPVSSLSKDARQAFSAEGNKISAEFRARHIIFSDKSKIEVK